MANSSAAHIQRAKTLKELEPLAQSWEQWTKCLEDLGETTTLLQDSDPEIRDMASEEHASLSQTLRDHFATFPSLLLPESQTSQFSALVEMKAGAGGDESTIFLSEMMRMYTRMAQNSSFTVEIVSFSPTDPAAGSSGGGKEAILEIKGPGAYDKFRFESGVHRVQRVPATETKGRLHTSTIAVVVLPTSDEKAADDLDVVDPKDVRTDVMRAQGAGGQHVNRTESAVRLTHEPTGITVTMQDSRSQHANRAKAWQILRARLLDRKMLEEQKAQRDTRRNLVKSADRSEKIRTYNFPQDRLTDHRINYSVNNLDGVMEGGDDSGLEEIISELQQNHSMAQIEEMLDKAS
ncbi:peptide chain release factor 1 [Clavulina sp. PMI_390]|nr:peptide chain release factor 1 [Clavulina sp. PMI_390]